MQTLSRTLTQLQTVLRAPWGCKDHGLAGILSLDIGQPRPLYLLGPCFSHLVKRHSSANLPGLEESPPGVTVMAEINHQIDHSISALEAFLFISSSPRMRKGGRQRSGGEGTKLEGSWELNPRSKLLEMAQGSKGGFHLCSPIRLSLHHVSQASLYLAIRLRAGSRYWEAQRGLFKQVCLSRKIRQGPSGAAGGSPRVPRLNLISPDIFSLNWATTQDPPLDQIGGLCADGKGPFEVGLDWEVQEGWGHP